jgi:acyl-CoA dehydrogenase
MHTHLVALQAWRHKRNLPAPILSRVAGENLMLISTGASDWIDSQGTAVRVEGGFRVTGRKSPSSGCPSGDVLMSSARCEDVPGDAQVIHFSVPFAAAGVSIVETWDTMGMRATGSHTVVLDDVFVPEAAVSLTRSAGQWHPIFDAIVGVAMPLIMSVYVGVASEAVDRAIALASKRSHVDATAPTIGRMINRLVTAQDATAAAIAMSDDLRFANTDEHASAVLSRKTIAADAAIDAVRLAMEVGGGASYSTGSGIERLYRDVHGSLYHPLPSAKQEMFTGRLGLGLAPVAVS